MTSPATRPSELEVRARRAMFEARLRWNQDRRGPIEDALMAALREASVFRAAGEAKIEAFAGEYRFLSNFWPAAVVLDGEEYPTVEHAYQAAKTLNHDVRYSILVLPSPGKAKRAGSIVWPRPDWEDVKIDVMRDLVTQKFSDVTLRELLLSTVGNELIEGNSWCDTFWGVCSCENHDGVGANNLGLILTEIREQLAQEVSASEPLPD